jgi:hypothetical protein
MKTMQKKKSDKKDIAASYNTFKEYNGQQYTGMKIGRSHKWNYDSGVWKEKKITPDKWEVHFAVDKHRAGHAPEGSGVPIGTEYNWYIMAHQLVKKLDANTYSTELTGFKFKLAHKRSDAEKWNISDKTQRKHLINILQGFIEELEKETVSDPKQSEREIVKKIKVPVTKKTRIKKEELAEA